MIQHGNGLAEIAKRPLRELKRYLWRIQPVAANPYATHVPVLVACARVFKPLRILELGSGRNSTPLFLNKEIFPDVVRVCSLENDSRWFEYLDSLKDTRLEPVFVKGSMHDAVDKIDCSAFDLIFVDDSPTADERGKTLDSLRRRLGASQIVVVHDFDLWPIRRAVHSYRRYQGMFAMTPQCAIAWDKREVDTERLRQIDSILLNFHAQIREDDAARWRDRLNESMPAGLQA